MEPIKMKTYAVNSSNIKSMGYDPPTKTMQIDFWNKTRYQYHPIDFDLFKQLVEAKSIGNAFSKSVRYNKDVNYIKLNP